MIKNTQVQELFKKLNEKLFNISSIEDGMLGGINVKYWVKCRNKDYLFKYDNNLDDYSSFGEVFTSYLSFVLGYNCVKAVFSKDLYDDTKENVVGVMLESYRTKNVKEIISFKKLLNKYKDRHLGGYTVKEAVTICREFCEDNNLILDKNLEQELKEMALMDYLLIQTDRHTGNIEFLVEQKGFKKVLKLAPMFDNGYCLYLNNLKSTATKILKILSDKKTPMSNKDANPKPQFYIEETEDPHDENDICVVRDLASELLRNEKLMKLYENFKKLDFKREVDFIRSIYKKNIPETYYNLMLKGVENRVHFLDLELTCQIVKQENIEQTL